MKIIPIIYTVRGTGPFPIDMLREDGACPYSERDSYRVAKAIESPFLDLFHSTITVITLIKHNGYHLWTPNSAKWKSFGWDVISVEEKRT